MTNTPTYHCHALVIGIDEYPYVHANPLHGCRNDAERIAGLLADAFGFRVRLLLDREATRDAIQQALQQLLRQARENDRVVVHFSGHGSRIESCDGTFVETLVPHDSGRGEYANRDITDQYFYSWLLELSSTTPYVTLIFDSCHAGGIVRDLEAPVRGIEPDRRPEALAAREAFVRTRGRAEGHRGGPWRALRKAGASGWLPLSDRYTLIAACRADERARELEDPTTGQIHGALTCFLAQELARVTGRCSYRDVFERVAREINTCYQEQNPQLEGAWDREIFGIHHIAPMRFVPIRLRNGRRVELAAGAAHGLVLGSEWQIYGSGTHRIEEAKPLGRLRIDEVRAIRAGAELMEEAAAGAVEVGGRAVEVARPPESRRLAVWLEGACRPVDELAQRIGRSPFLDLASDPERSDAVAQLLASRDQGTDVAPVVKAGPVTGATWIVTDRSGRHLMKPKPMSPLVCGEVVRNLETRARQRALLQLRHPDPQHPLRDVLEIELLRRGPGEDWRLAKPESDGGFVYLEGDLLGIRLRHEHAPALHVAVLDLGLTGAVHLLYPVRGAPGLLPAGRDLEVGLDQGERLELYVPAELPYHDEIFERGRETLVFVATTEEADLGLLIQQGVRGTAPRACEEHSAERPAANHNPLATLLHLALGGVPDRDIQPLPRRSAELWTVTTRSFWLSRS